MTLNKMYEQRAVVIERAKSLMDFMRPRGEWPSEEVEASFYQLTEESDRLALRIAEEQARQVQAVRSMEGKPNG